MATLTITVEIAAIASTNTQRQLVEVEIRLIGTEIATQHRTGDKGLGAVAIGAIEAPVLSFCQLLRVQDAAIV